MTNDELATSLREFAEDIREKHLQLQCKYAQFGTNLKTVRLYVHSSFADTLDEAAKALTGGTITVEAHDPKDLPVEFVMNELHELIFSKRRAFWSYLEQCLFRTDDDDGNSFTIAWPDGFSHLGREEFNAALQHAKQSTDKTP